MERRFYSIVYIFIGYFDQKQLGILRVTRSTGVLNGQEHWCPLRDQGCTKMASQDLQHLQGPAKSLVTKWEFNPETETFRITTLRAQGLVTQQFRMDNIIPSTYPDMIAATRIPEPTYPVFLDSVMLYFNKFNDQTFLFEHDGTWVNETVQHPKLSLQNTVNQKQWLDRRPAQ